MFARTVRMHLKPNNLPQFTETMEKDVELTRFGGR
jgi:hypothetical protein